MSEDRPVTTPSAALVELAQAYGIATHYTDWRGEPVDVPAETVTRVLAAMEVDASDPEAALEQRRLAPWRRMLPPSVVVHDGERREIPVHVPHLAPVEVVVVLADGGERTLEQVDQWVDPTEVDGEPVGEARFEVPPGLPLGYHRLRARSGDLTGETTLVVTPSWLGLPASLGERRGWGLAAQLYSVRSRRSWGVGDLADLTDLAVWSGADLGADYVLVNPLHAAEPVAPMQPSPYLPTSRRFFNPLYLRVERVPEYVDLPDADRRTVEKLAQQVHAALDGKDVVDRDTAWTAKREALRLVHAVPRSAGRELDYRAFRERHGEALRDVATWSVLAQRHGNDARQWPDGLRDVDSPQVAAFAREHADEVDFESWLQWLLDEQLQAAQAKAVGAGMALGTMHDLAVGVHPGGADAWRMRATYANGIQVGAPPDPSTSSARTGASRPGGPTGSRSSATHRSATSSGRCSAMPAGCASTTSSGCSGCGGSRRGGRPPRAPTSTTTTRRWWACSPSRHTWPGRSSSVRTSAWWSRPPVTTSARGGCWAPRSCGSSATPTASRCRPSGGASSAWRR